MSLTRRDILRAAAVAAASPLLRTSDASAAAPEIVLSGQRLTRPLAITMWDFSWLERRWPGAGYEDWDEALGDLKDRGYDAVRIDAYPHLIEAGANRTWELLPCWNQQDWGSPALNRVRVQPALNDFLAKCHARGGSRRRLLYVDLCNEWPLDVWAPFYPKGTLRKSPEGVRWMRDAIAVVRHAHPGLSYTFSFTSEYDSWREQDVSMLDFLEPHLWMAQVTDFYEKVGYRYERFDSRGYENLVRHAERLYREQPEHWQAGLKQGIAMLAEWSRVSAKPLITTECWSLVDYKDWPLLSWGWIKELCEVGVRAAAETGRWVAIATSNFCGPQFRGMWRDVEWHRRMTAVIHRGTLPG